jgi:CRP/FNR family transcriptional regulator
LLGENLLAEEVEYPVSARCLEDSLICGLKREQFESIILEHPNVGLQVIKNMSRRISSLTDRIGDLANSDIEERLYSILMHIAGEHGQIESDGMRIPFPLTHEELGFLVGAHRVSVSRALKALKLAGKIASEGKSLLLLRPQ